ncbi:hypothetical protein DFH09DRAFT_1142160 [Mycena vulgaris]|nr:hypothetical protein DFH09DRAFT_1142160 [Mycena vulgaris]
MSHSNSLEIIFTKIRVLCRRIRFYGRQNLRVLWSIMNHLMQLQWRTNRFESELFDRPFSPTETHTFFTGSHSPIITAQSNALASLDSHVEFDLPLSSDCESSPAPSTLTTQTPIGGPSFGMQGVDTLQPMVLPHELEPILPGELMRYEPKEPISTEPATYTVKALQTVFRSESSDYLPLGWIRLAHFEGQPFFYHEEKKILTETWMYNPDFSREITSFIEMIEAWVEANQFQLPRNSELVLELRSPLDAEPGEFNCGYYYASHDTRSIFWLQEFCLDGYLREVRGGQLAPEHVKLQLEFQYWKHFELFETIQVVSSTVLNELWAIILNNWSDVMTCTVSTVNLSQPQLRDMLKIVQGAIDGQECSLLVGKFMSLFFHERFINYHGQEAARLTRHQSVHGPSQDRRSWLMSVLSPILFYAPDTYLYNLDKIWVDNIAAKEPSINWISKLTTEWTEHTAFVCAVLVLFAARINDGLQAAILLNANVAFLDIPGVAEASQSLTQIFSYISIVLVIGSIILGLMLVRQHRTKHIETAVEAANFLSAHKLETTAILYALPYALLMYGMICFLAAFLMSCFWSTTLTARLTVGVFWTLISALILWAMLWQSSEDSTTRVLSWLARVKSAIERDTSSSLGDQPGEIGHSRKATDENAPASQEELEMKNQDTLNTAEMIV